MEEQNQTLDIQCHQGETLLSHLVLVMYGVEDWLALAIMMTHQTRQMLRQYEPVGVVHMMWVAWILLQQQVDHVVVQHWVKVK